MDFVAQCSITLKCKLVKKRKEKALGKALLRYSNIYLAMLLNKLNVQKFQKRNGPLQYCRFINHAKYVQGSCKRVLCKRKEKTTLHHC